MERHRHSCLWEASRAMSDCRALFSQGRDADAVMYAKVAAYWLDRFITGEGAPDRAADARAIAEVDRAIRRFENGDKTVR